MDTKKRQKLNRSWVYPAAVLGLVGLLSCAFLLPQFLFRVSDNALYSEISLSERETVDVTLLSSTYEPSLYNRMSAFAEGIANGVSYYVSEQKMEVNQELYEQLMTENGIFQEPVTTLMELQMISGSFLIHYVVETWKQYVIYNDDYTKGVNFIIWYLELVGDEGEQLEILMDAETSTIYGIAASKNHPVLEEEWDKWIRSSGAYSLSLRFEIAGFDTEDWWYFYSYYYEAISQEELRAHYIYDTAATDVIFYDNLQIQQKIGEQTENLAESEWFGVNDLSFTLPYDGRPLELHLKLLPVEEEQSVYYRDMVFGIVPICRLIPEFEQNF